MAPMTQGLGQLIDEVSAVEFRGLKGLGKPPKQWAKKKKPAAKPRKRAS
jgi:hypothetical protein